MKKIYLIPYPVGFKGAGAKAFLYMKLIFLFLLIGMVGVSAESYSQNSKISLQISDGSLLDLFSQIENNSEYLVFYQDEIINKHYSKRINLHVQDVEISSILESVFKDMSLTYKMVGRQIAILQRKSITQQNIQEEIILIKDNADERIITGTVTDEDGEPIPGVNIIVKGTQLGTTTDMNGSYRLNVPENSTIIYSFIGFTAKEITAGNQSIINVILTNDISELTEFVITGYGVQDKRSITGAMSSVSKEALENFPVQSFDRALQGQVSGVNVMAANGVPGGPVRINIRGIGSITAGNQPLIIVDGVQLNMTETSGQTASNPLAFLNNNDIESIEVLKDGAAASIYGAQAANGVLLVTTKKGSAGKTQFNVNYFHGVTEPMPQLQMMNSQQFLDVRFEARNNRYPTRTQERNRQDVLSSAGLSPNLTDAEIANLPTYNWQDPAFTTGRTNNVELSASGGNEKTTFYLSGSYNKADGNVIGIDFQRSTAKVNLTHQENERLSFNTNINLSSIIQNGTSGSNGSSGAYAAPQYAAPHILPFIPINLEDGSPNAPIEGFPGSANRNPIYETMVHTLQSRTKSIVGNFQASYKIMDNLVFKSFYGLDFRLIDDERYVDPRTRSGAASQGSLSIGTRQSTNFITNQTITYNQKFDGGHNLSFLGGAEYRSDVRERSSVSASGFTTHQFRTLQSAAVIGSASGSWSGFKRFGIFGQANYDFNKKYLLSAVLRYDGSSRFGANNKFGWFPAISAGWNITEEEFLTSNSWIDQLKLRIGYGETGNDAIGDFDSRGLYGGSSSTNYNQEPGISPTGIANTNLAWERNVTTNIGLDYMFFNGRIGGAVEVFRRLSKDLLLNQPLPYLSGYSNVTNNVGELLNEGLEFELRTVNVRKNNFEWTTNFNITFIRNEVLKLLDDEMVLPGNQSVRVGYPLGTNFTRHYAGVNSATGRPMWYDSAGEITYNPLSPEDFVTFGSELSDFFGGFTNSFRYKGFTASVFFQYDYGRELSNVGMNRFIYNGTDTRNTLEQTYLDRWTTPGQITTIPRPFDGGSEVNSASHATSSSRFLEDASFIRLKQLSVSYDLPLSMVNRMKLRSARIYGQGVNLLTWTKWTGYDPELIINEGNFSSTQGTVPQTRVYTMGIQLGF